MTLVSYRNSLWAMLAFGVFVGTVSTRLVAGPVVKIRGEGLLQLSDDGTADFALQGNASHLGKFVGYGEVSFALGEESAGMIGEGLVVLEGANGDRLVGVIVWTIDANGNGEISFSWRDSIQLSDETIVSTSGRFIRSRPAGAVTKTKSILDGTSNIIAILIG